MFHGLPGAIEKDIFGVGKVGEGADVIGVKMRADHVPNIGRSNAAAGEASLRCTPRTQVHWSCDRVKPIWPRTRFIQEMMRIASIIEDDALLAELWNRYENLFSPFDEAAGLPGARQSS